MKKFKRIVLLILSVIFFGTYLSVCSLGADNFENEISAFPESYRVYLRELHKKYPDWKFECINTGLDWYAAVEGENYAPSQYTARSAIASSANNLLKDKSPKFYTVSADGKTETFASVDAGFVRPNKIAISYYMDPRNFLNETDIFQFELLSFSEYIQVKDVDRILSGTFMYNTKVTYYDSEGKLHTNTFTYAQCIYDAGKTNNINPCFLASKIKNEIVVSGGGPSGSVTGQYKGYEGFYNFFNIGAYSGTSPISNGLQYASQSGSYGRPWNTPKKSINGGAQYLAEGYIAKGQNTGYFQKFNVSPNASSTAYTHQYMTNIVGSVSQAKSTYNSYSADGLMNLPRTFLIPVFKNMPGADEQMKNFAFLDSRGQKGITNERVNVRKVPSLENSSVITTISKDTPVTVLSKCRNGSISVSQQVNYPFWYQVEFTQGSQTVVGYILANYVTILSEIKVKTGSSFTLPVMSQGSEVPTLYTWEDSVISIGADNTVKALKSGTAYITATTSAGGYEYIKVNVGNFSNLSLNISDFSMTYLSGGVTFSWKAVTGASGYEFTIFDGNNILYTQNLSACETSLTLNSFNSKSDFSAKIRAYSTDENSKLCGEFSYIYSADARLEQVSGVVCENITTSSYTLRWKAVSGATGYQVYRYNGQSGKYELYKTLGSTYLDFKSLGAGSYEKYIVRAYAQKKSGIIYSPYSEPVEGYTYLNTTTAVPTASEVEKTSVTVKWTAVSGAKLYYVYRYDTALGYYVKVGETTGTAYVFSSLKEATAYRIKIEAVDNSSTVTKKISGCEITFYTLPGKINGLKQTSSTGSKINISWNKIQGASSYMVYLLDNDSGKYKLYLETEATACSLTSRSPLSTDNIKVCAVIKNGNDKLKGEFSDVLKVYTGPKKVSGLKNSDISTDSITLKWSKVSGADGYKVYRINLSTGESKLIAKTTKTTYACKSLKPGKEYKFKVRAYRKIGSVKYNGTNSEILKVRTAPGAVSGMSTSNRSTGKYTIKWKKLQNADGYIVYKYNSSSGKYEKLAKTKKVTYKLKGLSSAQKDTYKVAGYVTEGGKDYVGELSKAFKATTLPKNTSKVTAEKDKSGKLSVSWQSVARASGYRVYAYDKNTGKWVSLGCTSKTRYTVSQQKMKSAYSEIKVRSYVKINSKRYYSSGKTTKIS